jgi:FkbM family methyltransferase
MRARTIAHRARFMNDAAITVVLDVGAHTGDYASSLRPFGYKGGIESFEPLARVHAELSSRAAGDSLWTSHRLALGDRPGTLTLHVAGNEVSSSALEMLPRHVQGDRESSYVGSEQVRVRTLEELGLTDASDRAYLRADVCPLARPAWRSATGVEQALCCQVVSVVSSMAGDDGR